MNDDREKAKDSCEILRWQEEGVGCGGETSKECRRFYGIGGILVSDYSIWLLIYADGVELFVNVIEV